MSLLPEIRRVGATIVVLLLVSRLVSASYVYWDPSLAGGNGHLYKFFSGPLDFDGAKAAAEAEVVCGVSGHLATSTSSQENEFLLTLFPSVPGDGPWLGASQPSSVAETAGTEILDQQSEDLPSDDSSGDSDTWQSFTAGISGILTRLEIRLLSDFGPFLDLTADGTLSIYEGEGVQGILLATEDVTFGPDSHSNGDYQAFTFSNPAIINSGSAYSFRMETDDPTKTIWAIVDVNDPYSGGRYKFDASWDILFKTFVTPQNIFAVGWGWVTNEAFGDYTDWLDNQPNAADEDCLHFYLDSFVNGSWNDMNCSRTLPYLVEIDGPFADRDGDGVPDCLETPDPTPAPTPAPTPDPTPEPTLAPIVGFWTEFRGKTYRFKVRNPLSGPNVNITGMRITWPSSNGQLRQVKRFSRRLFVGRIDPPSYNITNGEWDSRYLTDLQLTPGQEKEYKIKFQSISSMVVGNYTVVVEFGDESEVTVLEQDPSA